MHSSIRRASAKRAGARTLWRNTRATRTPSNRLAQTSCSPWIHTLEHLLHLRRFPGSSHDRPTPWIHRYHRLRLVAFAACLCLSDRVSFHGIRTPGNTREAAARNSRREPSRCSFGRSPDIHICAISYFERHLFLPHCDRTAHLNLSRSSSRPSCET